MSEYRAGERFLNLLRAGRVPPAIRRDAACGRLSLPFGDRLNILVFLASPDGADDGELAESARQTLVQLSQDAIAEVVSDPTCPDRILEWYASAQSENAEPFELVDASEEEQAALKTRAGRPGEGLIVRIARMNPAQRVQAGLRGGRDERMLLIRDTNRVVWRAVLESPRLTDADVELIAAMRNVHEDVLRYIAGQKRFLRSLSVIRNLINNPRTPQDVSVPLLKHLFAVDLHNVARNRMLSDPLRRQAAKLLQMKQSS